MKKRTDLKTLPILTTVLVIFIIAGIVTGGVTNGDNIVMATYEKFEMPSSIPLLPETKSIDILEEPVEQSVEQPVEEPVSEYVEEYYYEEPAIEWYLSREAIINYAYEVYGVSEEWTIWLIGTTWNEDYHDDRYLEYAWACEIINCYSNYSVWDLDCIWGSYYSISHAYEGYYAADYTCLEMVWEALTNTDTRIVEVDGMIDWYVPGYYLIYDSPYHNCQVWGGY